MPDELHEFRPDWTLHPGVILREILGDRSTTTAELAAATGLAEDAISGIIGYTTAIDEEIASRLAAWSGTSVQFWLNAQRIYEEALASGAKDCSEEYR